MEPAVVVVVTRICVTGTVRGIKIDRISVSTCHLCVLMEICKHSRITVGSLH